MSFNLTCEAWIPVVNTAFQIQEMSLIELFENWEKLRSIQADNPPTTLVLYRFLLAILHRAYQGPHNVDHWEEIYGDNGVQAINYLKEKADRFDLLDPVNPFMQDPSIDSESTSKCYSYLAYEMHGENTSTVFCHDHHWSNSSLSLGQAARLLLRLQSFDLYGRKMGISQRAKAIPIMNSVITLVMGNNLKDTTLKNLIRYDPVCEYPSVVRGSDLPSWEINADNPTNHKAPNGYISYLTYQWRRLKIFSNERQVFRVVSHPGDSLPVNVSEDIWECSIPYVKGKQKTFPLPLTSSKAIWRDSTAFLQSSGNSVRPRILDWYTTLSAEELVPRYMHMRIFGLQADQASPIEWFNETFSASIQFLTDHELWISLSHVISIAEKHKEVFHSSKRAPYYALGEVLKHGDPGKLAKSLDGESRYWAMLDQAFPKLLDELPKDVDVGADGILRYGGRELPKWTQTVQRAARQAFTESIESIRNYHARAKALQALEYHLRKLRGKDAKKSV